MFRVLTILVLFFLLPSVLVIQGCEFETYISVNSSEGDNDYFEEPLTGRSERFAAALQTSNRFIDLFSSDKLDEARALFDSRLKHAVSPEDLELLRKQVFDGFGSMVEYLPMQWGFLTTEEDGEKVVYSTKIVVHEKSSTFYIFVFADGVYDQIYGLNVRRRNGDERINDALNAARGT